MNDLDNIKQLLFSKDENNFNLGLELLKGLGDNPISAWLERLEYYKNGLFEYKKHSTHYLIQNILSTGLPVSLDDLIKQNIDIVDLFQACAPITDSLYIDDYPRSEEVKAIAKKLAHYLYMLPKLGHLRTTELGIPLDFNLDFPLPITNYQCTAIQAANSPTSIFSNLEDLQIVFSDDATTYNVPAFPLLQQLRLINIGEHQLIALLPSLVQFPKLETLVLDLTILGRLPESITQLTNIENLTLSNGNSWEFEDWHIDNWNNIKHLCIENTYDPMQHWLIYIWELAQKMPNLETLHFRDMSFYPVLPQGKMVYPNVQHVYFENIESLNGDIHEADWAEEELPAYFPNANIEFIYE